MGRSITALILTLVAGFIGIVVGHELLGGFPQVGPVFAIGVMGAFIIYWCGDRRK